MAQHTPAPWRVDYDPAESDSIWIVGADGLPIAKIEPCDRGDGKGETLSRQDFANAHVLAVAPVLLAFADKALSDVLSLEDIKGLHAAMAQVGGH